MENLEFYNKFKDVPNNAKKQITSGRLNGMTDINPMWRIKCLTEQFGPCGIGWKTKIVNKWIENGANEESIANIEIELYVKVDGQWSEAIPGIGGSKFVAKETRGLYTSDECYKMAYTDALSVACKALGIGASVYWDESKTKYNSQNESSNIKKQQEYKCAVCSKPISEGLYQKSIQHFNVAVCCKDCLDCYQAMKGGQNE